MEESVAKRQAQIDAEDEMVKENWRPIDNKLECFRMTERPPNESFLELKVRGVHITPVLMFRKFITPEIIARLEADFPEEALVMSVDKATGEVRRFKLTQQKIWQALAVQIRITGRQNHSTENDPNPRSLSSNVTEAKAHFDSLGYGLCANRESLERVIARCLLSQEYSATISANFVSVIDSLGQYIAGDEKLFHYTGDSPHVRLVPSKPDRVGLWFYQLAGRLRNNLPFLLDTFMHDSSTGVIKVSSVVQRWANVIAAVPRSEKCYLAFDSYYTDSAARTLLQQQKIRYTASAQSSRFNSLVRAVHPSGKKADTLGEWRGLYNDNTREVFVYHYDTQKGVGVKYNLSWGFERSINKTHVKEHSKRVPVYDNYKSFFDVCDNFNRALHHKTWPHKRGGRDTSGDIGRHHDFLLACVLQNTRNAYITARGISASDESFREFCDMLADQIIAFTMTS